MKKAYGIGFFFLNGFLWILFESVWTRQAITILGNSPFSWGSVLFTCFAGMAIASFYLHFTSHSTRLPFHLPVMTIISLVYSILLFYFSDRFSLLAFAAGTQHLLEIAGSFLVFFAVFPSAFFLGMFLPLASKSASSALLLPLYAVQSLAAILGVYFGAAFLPDVFGYKGTFLAGFLLTLLMSFFFSQFNSDQKTNPIPTKGSPSFPSALLFSAFFSGLLSLGLQSVLTRWSSIRTDNSVLSFAALSAIPSVMVVLASIAISRMEKQTVKRLLPIFPAAGSIMIVLGALFFVHLPPGLMPVNMPNALGFSKAMLSILPFTIIAVAGITFIFPSLLRFIKEDFPGSLSLLFGVNFLGCAIGSLIVPFFLLPLAGLWISLFCICIGYAMLVFLLTKKRNALLLAGSSLLFLFLVNPLSFPLTDISKSEYPSTLISAREGKFGIVSTVDENLFMGNIRSLWLNNNYKLEAGSSDIRGTYRMGILPLLIHPYSESAACIGMGTGIWIRAFLDSGINSVVAAELIPEVVEAAKKDFSLYNGNALQHPSLHLHVGDGRTLLRYDERKYDIISCDLFTPWNESTSFMYSLEHFRVVASRLNPSGSFFLYLPLFQLTIDELELISQTMVAVFSNVTLWRLNTSIDLPVVCLVGRSTPIDVEKIQNFYDVVMPARTAFDVTQLDPSGLFCLYLGPITRKPNAALNTIDHPRLEFLCASPGRRLLSGRVFWDWLGKWRNEPMEIWQGTFTSKEDFMVRAREGGFLLSEIEMTRNPTELRKLEEQIEKLIPAVRIERYLMQGVH